MASGREDYYFPDIELTAMLAKMDDNITALGVISTDLDAVNIALGVVADKLSIGEDLIDSLDLLDGTMDGRLTLGELDASQIHDDLVASIDQLVLTVAELVGVHADTTDLIAMGEEDTSGTAGDGSNIVLVSGINQKRNVLVVNNTDGNQISYARTYNAANAGVINSGSSATFHDAPGVWLGSGITNWTAHEEWAT